MPIQGSQIQVAQSALTANATLANQPQLVLADASGGTFTITMPLAANVKPGLPVVIQKTDGTSTAVDVVRAGADTINGATSYTLNAAYQSVSLYSDGVSKWTTNPSLTQAQVGARAAYGI